MDFRPLAQVFVLRVLDELESDRFMLSGLHVGVESRGCEKPTDISTPNSLKHGLDDAS